MNERPVCVAGRRDKGLFVRKCDLWNMRRYGRNDILLIAGLLLIGLLIALLLLVNRRDGREAVVRVEGAVVARLALGEEREFPVEIDGRVANLLRVADGGVRMVEADCPDKLCVRKGAVRYAGDSIVCLPHRVVVEIVGEDELGLDAVAG